MLIDKVKQLKPLDRFLYWIREREQILRKKRAGLGKPWSDDTIFQSVYFTNVHREDDKATKWFAENIREPLCDKSEVVFATIAFRWFNWPRTGECLHGIGDDHTPSLFVYWDLHEALRRLDYMKELGEQVFTGAFNISNSGSTKPKINRVCEDYIQPVWEDRENLCSFLTYEDISLDTAHRKLKSYPGLGGSGFMAQQVVADLIYTHVLETSPDRDTWSCPGTGSKRGMERLSLSGLWADNVAYLRSKIKTNLRMDLHSMNVTNCLCEFDKYERVLWNEGRSKRKYEGM